LRQPPPTQKKNNEAVEILVEPINIEVRLRKWFPDLDPGAVKSLSIFYLELVKSFKAINLISAASIKNADAVHFADGILASRLIKKALTPDQPLYDFGSGNGFPGLIFAILYPQWSVVLMDKDSKKIDFCKQVAILCGLKNVKFEVKSLDELPDGSVLNIVVRGFGPLSKTMMLARKSVKLGGKLFHMKADSWANELSSVPSQLFSFWTPSLLGQYRIPETSVDMAVVLTQKTAE
jgi:16S rRNA (guanine527-N7)-methyltransferase